VLVVAVAPQVCEYITLDWYYTLGFRWPPAQGELAPPRAAVRPGSTRAAGDVGASTGPAHRDSRR